MLILPVFMLLAVALITWDDPEDPDAPSETVEQPIDTQRRSH